MGKREGLTILKTAYHRNGISGVGFTVVLFTDDAFPAAAPMVACIFDNPSDDIGEFSGYCAVLSVPELAQQNIEFANGNSWRGDDYEHTLRAMLKKQETV